MYQVFSWIFLFGSVGSFIRMILQKSQSLMLLWTVFLGFWASMLYHAFINFINVGNPATTGRYLLFDSATLEQCRLLPHSFLSHAGSICDALRSHSVLHRTHPAQRVRHP